MFQPHAGGGGVYGKKGGMGGDFLNKKNGKFMKKINYLLTLQCVFVKKETKKDAMPSSAHSCNFSKWLRRYFVASKASV